MFGKIEAKALDFVLSEMMKKCQLGFSILRIGEVLFHQAYHCVS